MHCIAGMEWKNFRNGEAEEEEEIWRYAGPGGTMGGGGGGSMDRSVLWHLLQLQLKR